MEKSLSLKAKRIEKFLGEETMKEIMKSKRNKK
jgi:hypothetical protein